MWAGAKRWLMTLLVAWLCASCVAIVLWLWGAGVVGAIIGGAVGVTVLVVRGFMPQRFDDVYAYSEIWLFDHPVVYIGLYAAAGALPVWPRHQIEATLFSMALWSGIGYLSLRGWRKRVATVRASH
jgi:hypothetical protein